MIFRYALNSLILHFLPREFCKMVKKIFVYTIDEVKKMTPRCRPPTSSVGGEGTTVNLDSELKSKA